MAFDLHALISGLIIVCTNHNINCVPPNWVQENYDASLLLIKERDHTPVVRFRRIDAPGRAPDIGKVEGEWVDWEIYGKTICVVAGREPGARRRHRHIPPLSLTGGRSAHQEQPAALKPDSTAFGWMASLSEVHGEPIQVPSSQWTEGGHAHAWIIFRQGELSSRLISRHNRDDTGYLTWNFTRVAARVYKAPTETVLWRMEDAEYVHLFECNETRQSFSACEEDADCKSVTLRTRRPHASLLICNSWSCPSKDEATAVCHYCCSGIPHFAHYYSATTEKSSTHSLECSDTDIAQFCNNDLCRDPGKIPLNNNNVFCPPTIP